MSHLPFLTWEPPGSSAPSEEPLTHTTRAPQGPGSFLNFTVKESKSRKPSQPGCICMPPVLRFDEGTCQCCLCCPGPPCIGKTEMCFAPCQHRRKIWQYSAPSLIFSVPSDWFWSYIGNYVAPLSTRYKFCPPAASANCICGIITYKSCGGCMQVICE